MISLHSSTLLGLNEISWDSPFKPTFDRYLVLTAKEPHGILRDNPFKSYQRKMLLNTTTGSLLAGSRVVSSSLQSQRQKTNCPASPERRRPSANGLLLRTHSAGPVSQICFT
jgi:hypothetical protein